MRERHRLFVPIGARGLSLAACLVALAAASTSTAVAQRLEGPGLYIQTQATRGDARDGSVRWRYRSERPMLAALTTTSGGLVFTGEVTGAFVAFDADSGEVLYRFNTGGPIGGGVVTYAVNGRRYVATTSGKPSHLLVGRASRLGDDLRVRAAVSWEGGSREVGETR